MTPAQADRTGDLGGEFPPANMDAWRQLIDKALKGGDFERRLVARTADGLRIEPVFARRPDAATTTASAGGAAPHAWDIRQLHAEADPTAANAAILEALAGGASSITLQIAAASWSGLACGATEIARALDGVLLDVCPVALHAGDQTTEAAAHLITLWTARGLSAEQRRGAFNYDPLGT